MVNHRVGQGQGKVGLFGLFDDVNDRNDPDRRLEEQPGGVTALRLVNVLGLALRSKAPIVEAFFIDASRGGMFSYFGTSPRGSRLPP